MSDIRPPEIEIELEKEIEIEKEREGETGHPAPAAYGRYNNVILTDTELSGLVKCADCGWSLAYGVNSQNKNPYAHYHCSKYGQGLHLSLIHI